MAKILMYAVDNGVPHSMPVTNSIHISTDIAEDCMYWYMQTMDTYDLRRKYTLVVRDGEEEQTFIMRIKKHILYYPVTGD